MPCQQKKVAFYSFEIKRLNPEEKIIHWLHLISKSVKDPKVKTLAYNQTSKICFKKTSKICFKKNL